MQFFLPQKNFNDLNFTNSAIESDKIAISRLFNLFFQFFESWAHFITEIFHPLFFIDIASFRIFYFWRTVQ